MKHAILALAFCSIASPALAAQRKVAVPAFDSLEAAGAFEIKAAIGGPQSLVLTGDEADLERVSATVKDHRLVLETRMGRGWNRQGVKVRLAASALQGASLSGACKLEARPITKAFKIDLSGACQAKLAGKAESLTASLSGASRLDAADLPVQDASVDASGACHASVKVRRKLKASASGVSVVEYEGHPQVESDVSGVSAVRRSR